MSVRIAIDTEIPATPDVVWAAIEDLGTHTEWMADAERITFVTDQRAGVGTEFDCLTVVGPLRTTDRMTVTEWEPGAVMGIRTPARSPAPAGSPWRPRPGAPGSGGARSSRFRGGSVGRVGEIAGKPVLTWVWRRNLDRLRAYVLEASK